MDDSMRKILEKRLKAPKQRYVDSEVQAILKEVNISEGLEQMYQLGLSAGYATFFYLLEQKDLSAEDILKVTKKGLDNYPYVLLSAYKIVDEIKEGEKK